MHRIVLLAFMGAALSTAQPSAPEEHVHWGMSAPASAAPGSKFIAKLHATIDSGWHLYSLTTPQPGPVATTIKITGGNQAVAGVRLFEPKPITQYDANFQRDTETYANAVTFDIEITLKPDTNTSPLDLKASVRYQVCSITICIPPVTRVAGASINIVKQAAQNDSSIPGEYREAKPLVAASPSDDSALTFLFTAFGFGLAAIFTPCVFPMIPITVSYFLGQGQTTRRGDALKQAILFCLGIIVLFSGLGVAMTAVLGPFSVVQLGSNPWANGLIVLVFLVFGLSLLGAFEITIPSFILTKLDSASRGGGTAGTLLMGLTFSLASFACVGPFVGPLLAASASAGRSWRPLVGMASFATGLSLPFFLFALFPSYLKKLPKSGGWLARVKVVMGFVILAAALKYLAAMDQVLQWNFLTRDRFLAAWVVLFAMAGLYLLGFVRLEGVSKDDQLSIPRLLFGMAIVIFAVSLVPGMFGGSLGELEGFVPPPPAGSSSSQLVWLENDFNGAIAKARTENKRVLVNFTGYACTNCHWMKQNMFTRPEVSQEMRSLVLVDLYTDRDDAVSQQNQQLEQTTFHTIAIPFYVLYDPGPAGSEPRVVATFPGLTREAPQYISFLTTSSPAAAPASTPLDLGVAFASTDLSNKVVVANFWATWCVPCRKEIPEFNKLQDALGARGVQVLGVSLDDDADVIRPFQTKNPMHYPVGLATDETRKTYNLDQLPVTVVFNRKGEIVDRFVGYTGPEAIRAAVEKAL
jgi:thiol:disulfide interchange protein DsbD